MFDPTEEPVKFMFSAEKVASTLMLIMQRCGPSRVRYWVEKVENHPLRPNQTLWQLHVVAESQSAYEHAIEMLQYINMTLHENLFSDAVMRLVRAQEQPAVVVDKHNYSRRNAFRLLANKVMDKIIVLMQEVEDARKAELSFGPNRGLDTTDFINMRQQLSEIYGTAAHLLVKANHLNDKEEE